MEQQNDTWSVSCNCYDHSHPDTPKPGNLSFQNSSGFSFPGMKNHAGKPIDANLAVYFIQSFLKRITMTVTQPHDADYEQFVNDKNFDGMHKLYLDSKQTANDVINITSGTTFDRDVILKLLSQTGCAGLRLYLCARNITADDLHYSLVAVGIDHEGYDLNFKEKEGQSAATPSADMPGGKDVATKSLLLDFATPPPPNTLADNNSSIAKPSGNGSDRYVLLNFAHEMNDMSRPV